MQLRGDADTECREAMSEPEKPLHVRVAEALGWTRCSLSLEAGLSPEKFWSGRPLKDSGFRFPEDDEPYYEYMIPRYDTDWAVTGPLIERFGVWLNPCECGTPFGSHWTASANPHDAEGQGETPLEAVCDLILALSEAGKLPRG